MPTVTVIETELDEGQYLSYMFFRHNVHSVPNGLSNKWVPISYHYPMIVGRNNDIYLNTEQEVINFFHKNDVEISLEEAIKSEIS